MSEETADQTQTRLLTEIRDALRHQDERLTALEELAKRTAETVTNSVDSVTDLSRRVTHVTDQHVILRDAIENHTLHVAERLSATDAALEQARQAPA